MLAVAAGEPFLNGARIALEDELRRAPIAGLDTIFLSEVENLSGPAIENARRIVETPGLVAVIGHANSAASLAASPIYNAHEVVQIAPTSTAVTYSEAGPFSFRMVPPDDGQGPFLAAEVMDAFPEGAALAVFYVNDDYGRGLRETFLGALVDERYPVLLDLPHAEGRTTPEQIQDATKALVAAAPQVVVWLGRPRILERFLPAIRRELSGTPIYGGDALSQFPRDVGPDSSWRGIRYVDFVDPTGTAPLRDLSARFEQRFGHPPQGAAILTYEAVRLVLAAIRDGARTGPAIQRWLVSLGNERSAHAGVAGPVAFDEHGDAERDYVLMTVPGWSGR